MKELLCYAEDDGVRLPASHSPKLSGQVSFVSDRYGWSRLHYNYIYSGQ